MKVKEIISVLLRLEHREQEEEEYKIHLEWKTRFRLQKASQVRLRLY